MLPFVTTHLLLQGQYFYNMYSYMRCHQKAVSFQFQTETVSLA